MIAAATPELRVTVLILILTRVIRKLWGSLMLEEKNSSYERGSPANLDEKFPENNNLLSHSLASF